MLKRVCVNKSSLSVSGLRCSTGVLSKSAVAVNCRSIHTSWKGCTFQYQKSLPRLPIPDLTKTCDRYLKVVRPILDDAEYSRTKLVVGDFAENGHGDALHEALLKYDKSKGDSSYIDEFWSAMYLKDVRAPLPIHSNPFLQLVDDSRPGQQEAVNRAASLIASTLRFRDCLMNETLEPDVFHMGKTAQQDWFKTMMRVVPKSIAYYFAYAVKSYPLDMAQYPLLFGTARVPGADGDHLVSNDTATHIAVLSNGHVYQLDVYDKDGIALTEPTLAAKLRKIEQDSNERGASSTPVAALTSDTRDNWAVQRAELEKDNAQQLEMIDTALFTVSFDSSKPGNNTEAEAAEAGKVFLCGDVANRWYDKSLQFIVASNGAAAINFEHSWGDGVSVLRLANEIHEDAKAVEAVAAQEKSDAKAADKTTAAPEGDDAGAVDVVAEQEEAEPVTPLQWSLSSSVASAVKSATQRYNDEVNTLQIQALKINGFGKQFFKEQKIAPDGTVQQAIQLAYRRAFPDTPRAVATYESASTAAFKKGRTETIRPATIESSAMVNEFMNSSDKRADALRKAAEKHRQLSTEAALGQGVDRHLFALRKMAEQRGSMPGIFTDSAYAKVNHNILSTSTLVSDAVANGGFGPVVANGFGVGYATTDSQIGFMITSYKSQEEHQKFMQELKNALEEMKDVLEKN